MSGRTLTGTSTRSRQWAIGNVTMPDIEINTTRYEREHGHKPVGRRFWCFVLVSHSITSSVVARIVSWQSCRLGGIGAFGGGRSRSH